MIAIPDEENNNKAIIHYVQYQNSTELSHLPESKSYENLTDGSPIDFINFAKGVDAGQLLVVSYSGGKQIRVISLSNGKVVKELYRGKNDTVMSSLSLGLFSDPNILACSSDRKTVHLFKCPEPVPPTSEEKKDDPLKKSLISTEKVTESQIASGN